MVLGGAHRSDHERAGLRELRTEVEFHGNAWFDGALMKQIPRHTVIGRFVPATFPCPGECPAGPLYRRYVAAGRQVPTLGRLFTLMECDRLTRIKQSTQSRRQ